MTQKTRNTRVETLIQRAADRRNVDADLEPIQEQARRATYAGASHDETTEAAIGAVTSHVERHPELTEIAAQLALDRYHRRLTDESHGDRATYRRSFKESVRTGTQAGRLDERLLDYDLDELADHLQPERDELLDYMAVETLIQRYFLRVDERPTELPQAFWMRVAMGVALAEPEERRTERAKQYYDLLSRLKFVHSTPTLFHSGTTRPQMSSCYVTTVQDDLEHIFKSYGDHAQLSKWSGGLGNDWTNLRASGALIESTGVESTGVVPFLKISNDVTAAINRSGKRRGAACAYLEPWHLDYPDFVDLRRNTGDERRRTHDLNTAAWIPDLFMERVRKGGEWTLFSPDEVPGLHEAYGQEFRELYLEYEASARAGDLRQHETVDAEELWRKTLTRLFETGHPWITFKDPCNLRSPQDHAGTVHSSNLCTEITLNTSEDEHAVCNLGSVNLAAHTDEDGLDRDELRETVETATRMLDNVVDLNFYPTDEARHSNMRHRPVGLGVMGFHESLMKQGIPMASEEALEFADRSTEFVSYHAISTSAELAAERGPYPSYDGSKWSRGLLPQDTLDELEQHRGHEIPVPRGGEMDWSAVREAVAEHGMRNSNTMAVAPTATISTIAGTTPSIEPIYSNLYVKSNMSGDFTVVNQHLVDDLRELGLWDDEMVDEIKYHDGSIQEVGRVPDDLKHLYRGAFEIDPRHQIRLTARRSKWIDQSQSHNVFFPSTDGDLLEDVYMTAWERGLKTTYYLRTLAASQIEKSTLDTEEYGDTRSRDNEAATDGGERLGPDDELCRLEDPTCEACQ
ncbi:MAG: ribonucleoside-diphosphate reductase subunit alpha [Halobacteriales archaeon]